MKKTLRLVGVAAMVLLLAASCKKEEKNNGEKQMMTFSAGIEQTGAKTGLLPNGSHAFKQVWTEGDAISVNGNVITLDEGCDKKETGTFTVEEYIGAPYYAVYPAEPGMDGDIAYFTLPEEQDYVPGSYATNLAPMAACSENQVLTFKNLCGLMELSLVGDGITVTGLELSCDKPICGSANFDMSNFSTATLTMDEYEPGYAIAMNCVSEELPQGVQLDKNDATSFIFVLPPVTEGDFSLKVTYSGGTQEITLPENIFIVAGEVAFNNDPYLIEAGSSAPEGFVDLGTHVGGEGGTKPLYWAKCNLGATNPQDYGGYYPWGDITARTTNCTWDYYIYGDREPNVTKYCRTNDATVWRGPGLPDGILELDNSDDAAYVASGGANRMPTKEEYDELKQKAYFVWTSNYNGKAGCIIYKSYDHTKDYGFTKTSSHEYSTAAGRDEHIFIPAGGRLRDSYEGRGDYVKIWTKTLPCLVRPGDGWPSSFGIAMGMKEIGFIPGNYQDPDDYYQGRFYGMNLRPVCEGN